MARKNAADDLLGELNSLVGEVKPKGKSTKSERPEFDLLQSTQELLSNLAGATVLAKITEERRKALNEEFKGELWEEFTDHWFRCQGRPKNPGLKCLREGKEFANAIYQLKATFKVKAPEDGDVSDALKAVGFDDATIDKILDENVESETTTALRPFNELMNGSWISGKSGGKEFVEANAVEKSAANKLLKMVTAASTGDLGKLEPLTAEERRVVLTKQHKYVVKSGFLDRACSYCKSSEELRNLLSVIEPQVAMSHLKYGVGLAAESRIDKLISMFTALLKEEKSED